MSLYPEWPEKGTRHQGIIKNVLISILIGMSSSGNSYSSATVIIISFLICSAAAGKGVVGTFSTTVVKIISIVLAELTINICKL